MLKIDTTQLVTGLAVALLAWVLIDRVIPVFTGTAGGAVLPGSNPINDGGVSP